MFRTLRSRLTLWYVVILGLFFLGSDVILYRGFKKSLIETIDNTLYTAAEEVELSVLKTPPKKWKENIKQVERGFLVNRLFIQLLEITGTKEENLQTVARSGVLSGNISLRSIWEEISHQLPDKPIYMNVNVESPASHPLRIILYPVPRQGETGYLIQVGTSLKKIFSTLKNFLAILLISGPILLLVSTLGGYLILVKALHPVQTVVRTARRITTEDLALRIESKGRKDEIGLLITTFNEMISRLEHSVQQIKQFSSDASHDLKTPLTIIRGEIEIALRKERKKEEYKKTLTSVHEEAKKLEKLIDNLLFLTRIVSRDYPFLLKKTPLDEIVLGVFEKMAVLAAKKGLSYVIGKMEPAVVMGDAVLLNRLVANLLDNAVKYTPSGGSVEISLENSAGKVLLIVRDTGSGIPEESLPFIFDRFYRIDSSRSQRGGAGGSGLGLSIVKRIADIHHAVINVDSKIHQGSTFIASFPACREKK